MRRRSLASTLAFVTALVVVVPGQTATIDWKSQQTEILKLFRRLVQLDTANPPGNERRAVDYLETVLAADGIPSRTYALDPNRPNLVARIKGNGSKRPLLMLAHTDVVPVQRDKWPVDPFGAVIKDGYIWGRGTTDDKDKLTAILMTLLLLKRSGVTLDRDLIFLAESGEEADVTGVGIKYMVEQHFDAIDAEFAITEGPGATIENGRVTMVQITTSEKVPHRMRLIASGTSGHGSIPRIDNAVTHLAAAVQKVGSWQTPARLNQTTRTYFEKLASISAPDRAARYRSLLGLRGPAADAAQRYLAQFEPEHYSLLRTSVVPTMLKAGVTPNVIPSTAEATVDIRALPDEDFPAFVRQMGRIIDDPAISIVPLPDTRPVTEPSMIGSAMYRSLERAASQVYPGSVSVPSMLTAATDMAQLRAKGVQAYGVGPAMTREDFAQHGWHSDVERLSEASLYQFVQYVFDAVSDAAVKK
jgi:acetylornithine deacetylase/succinyl-diaminopimelate desuccinylase-like protein